jgi:hypothetical protein
MNLYDLLPEFAAGAAQVDDQLADAMQKSRREILAI